jgi:hypothetical protein
MANFNVEYKVVNAMPEGGSETTYTKRTVTDVVAFLTDFLQRFSTRNEGEAGPDVQFLTVRKVPEKVVRPPKPGVVR